MPHFRWQGLSSESLVNLVWVPSGMYASQGICPGIDLFYVPIVLNFITHFVQLVPFGQLDENFWGVGHAVNICMSKFKILL